MREIDLTEELFSFPEIDRGHWVEVCEFVKRFGCSTSVAFFDPACEIFSVPHIEGIIGFKTTSKCAVVFGNPACHIQDTPELMNEFKKYCQEHNKQIIYTAVSPKFTQWSLENGCKIAIEIGEELFLNPQDNFLEGSKGRKLRTKVRQAEKANVMVNEYMGHDLSFEKKLEEVAHSWLKGRQGPQIFLAHVDLFADRLGKRWFYASQDDHIIGVAFLNQLEEGWVLNLLMTKPEAINGTSELLVYKILEILQKEGCSSLSLGTVVKEQVGEIYGLKRFSRSLIRLFYKLAIKILRLEGRKHYWKKFHPKSLPSYLIFTRKKIGVAEISGVFRSLNTSL